MVCEEVWIPNRVIKPNMSDLQEQTEEEVWIENELTEEELLGDQDFYVPAKDSNLEVTEIELIVSTFTNRLCHHS